MRKFYRTLILILAISGLLLPLGCSENVEEDSSSSSVSSEGPGSEWGMTRTGSSYTFTMEDGSDGLTINATGETLSTGHTKLTVTSSTATGSATGPSNGDVAHAIEVSGTAFLLKPMEANSETIAMVSSGSCPSSDFDANWVIGHRPSGGNKITDDAADWFGTITWNTSSGQASFPLQRAVEDGGASGVGGEGGSQTLGSCSSGTVEASQSCNDGSTTMKVYFTTSGLAIVATCVDDSVDESHIIGIPQPSSSIAAVTSLYGDYAGFMFDADADETYAVTGSFASGSGTSDMTVQVVTGNDLDTNGSSYTFEIAAAGVDDPGNGFLNGEFSTCSAGSVEEADGTCEVVCAYAEDVNSSGKNMIYCVGQHPSDEDKRVTLLFVEN